MKKRTYKHDPETDMKNLIYIFFVFVRVKQASYDGKSPACGFFQYISLTVNFRPFNEIVESKRYGNITVHSTYTFV